MIRKLKQTISLAGLSTAIIGLSALDVQAQTTNPKSSPASTQVAQFTPGTATRSGPSYIGAGGNIGFGGDTALSQGSFAILSKIGLTRNFSIRPSALIEDDALFLIPITVDFPVETITDSGVQQISVAPYFGAGVAIATEDDDTVGFLLTGGVDVPVSRKLTATAGVNIGFMDDAEVGLLLGVGYNF